MGLTKPVGVAGRGKEWMGVRGNSGKKLKGKEGEKRREVGDGVEEGRREQSSKFQGFSYTILDFIKNNSLRKKSLNICCDQYSET